MFRRLTPAFLRELFDRLAPIPARDMSVLGIEGDGTTTKRKRAAAQAGIKEAPVKKVATVQTKLTSIVSRLNTKK
jgi:hypothetical protein